MALQQKQAYCKNCRRNTLHVKTEPKTTGCAGHILLCVLTCGLWFPIAVLIYGIEQWGGILAPWHCQVCGKKK